MVDYREILRFKGLRHTNRQIAASIHSGRDTVSEVLALAQEWLIPLPQFYPNPHAGCQLA